MNDIELVFEDAIPPKGNDIARGRTHWRQQGNWRDEWARRFIAQLGTGPWPKVNARGLRKDFRKKLKEEVKATWEPEKRGVLTVVAYRRRRIQDHDNFRTGLKPVIDGLVAAGWLVDDKDEYFGMDHENSKEISVRGKDPIKTVMRIRYEQVKKTSKG